MHCALLITINIEINQHKSFSTVVGMAEIAHHTIEEKKKKQDTKGTNIQS